MSARLHAVIPFVGLFVLLAASLAPAQTGPSPDVTSARSVIVPQTGAFALGRSSEIEITAVDVGVVVVEQVATTTMDISLRNPANHRAEAELLVPVPAGAVVRTFAFEGSAAEATANLLPKDEARLLYGRIVAKIRDPALLEFVGYSMIRSSVFPLAPRGTQKVRLTYEHLLTRDGDRIDYELPRSESLDYGIPWNIAVRIKSKAPISTVYSPSHEIETLRTEPGVIAVRTRPDAATAPGPFRLSYLLAGEGVSASLLAYPAPSVGGGYFMLLAGLPARPAPTADSVPSRREVTLVLDQSGSMRGEKIDQVREAARQVLAGLDDGEAFNIVVYSDTVRSFRPQPVIKNNESERAARAFLEGLQAGGGTNLHDALVETLRTEPPTGMLPLVLFLTDGLPTVGQTSEIAIRRVAGEQNPHNRRIFTFGVGADVNTPLLQKIAADTRATVTFVLPGEDVEVKVSQVFKGLRGPVLTDPQLRVVAADGQDAPQRVHDLMPARLPDLFEGDQLVLLGRYVGDEPLTFVLRGDYLGHPRTFRFTFTLERATTRNAFVPRLWASRRIASLIDEIRQSGADSAMLVRGRASATHGAGPMSMRNAGVRLATAEGAPADPRLDELTDEIVRLSTEFGILTEYTAFLAREGTDLARRDAVLAEARGNFQRRAMATRSGLGSVNQTLNNAAQMHQQTLNYANRFYDENMNRVELTAVQQVSDRAFFRRGDRWVDSRIIARETAELSPRRTIEFGSDEFRALVRRLASENRQGSIALRGDILLLVDGDLVLVRGAGPSR